MSRVLLTGGTGFLGRMVLPRLVRAGHEVHVVSSKPTELTPDVRVHRANLLVPGEASRVARDAKADALVHLAWYAEPGHYWRSPINFQWVEASLELVRAFHSYGGRRVVGAGTSAEYDWSCGTCYESTTPLRPATPYGASKAALGMLLSAFGDAVGIDVAWGRVFFLYGPHEHRERLVASVIRSLLRGESARTTSATQVRDFLHVSDAASAFVALLDSAVTGPVNIASGAPIVLRDMLELIASRLNRADGLLLGALPTRAGEPDVLVADVARLRDEVGWTPSIPLVEGLEQSIAWWRSHDE